MSPVFLRVPTQNHHRITIESPRISIEPPPNPYVRTSFPFQQRVEIPRGFVHLPEARAQASRGRGVGDYAAAVNSRTAQAKVIILSHLAWMRTRAAL